MKPVRRIVAIGVIAASSIAVTTLSGCRSSDAGPLADSTPGTGRVTKVALELNWPPGSASRMDNCGTQQPASQAPPRYAPAVWTQRPAPVANLNPPPAQSAPEPALAAAPPPSAPMSPVTDLAPKAATPAEAAEAADKDYLPDALPNGKVVSDSEPKLSAASAEAATAASSPAPTPINPLRQRAAMSEPDSASFRQTASSQAGEVSQKRARATETSTSAKQALTVDAPALSDFVEGNPSVAPAGQGRASQAEPVFHVVNNKRIKLHFEVKDTGPAGISGVELWYIHENREWQRPSATPQKQGPFVVEVDGEGLYGFKLIARNSQGGGEAAPRPGDPPQVWVLVDVTKPAVKITAAKVLSDGDTSRLELAWTARDKNLGHRPVTLLYAEQPEGPWLPMFANLQSTGACQKKLPPNMPKRFLVRAEAIDIAGNIGADQTRTFLATESATSRVSILKID